ncbi:CDP-glucose 4,6-dehydratase [Microbacterium laevaniformans]|uniref:CDP-glucose 4,6-dehydratase n=1 Tax=Microbacterium laevaniformans TaxID=36807 RepID=UPI00195637E0|nr:CDP-glucose 4,6-dehydratase [Microbacterium laevaniformans]GLJ63872.1 CDP-glucose 4,6-dehydratase [Microbacterium laevaniformans]
MHVLITGHTGFKGAWLTVLLHELGHTVSGLSLDPEPGALYEIAALKELVQQDHRVDIRDAARTADAIASAAPDAVVHLAAQPLVRRSYREPRFTYETNVMGTYNVLEASASVASVRAVVVATTDKVYRNVNRVAGYREDEALGGDDPYSSSKAMADLLTQSWAKSFPGAPIGIVRAGNVIGGGDVSADRLFVDLIEGFRRGTAVDIRYPDAVRPWQHVLDCLNGYVYVLRSLHDGAPSDAWNIGPDERSFITVREIADTMASQWSASAAWNDRSDAEHPYEAGLLALDASKAVNELGWSDLLAYPESLEWTVEWAKSVDRGLDARSVTTDQVRAFLSREIEARGA